MLWVNFEFVGVFVPMERIVLSGVYKNPEDMEYAFYIWRKGRIYCGGLCSDLQILNDTAVRLGMKITVLMEASVSLA